MLVGGVGVRWRVSLVISRLVKVAELRTEFETEKYVSV